MTLSILLTLATVAIFIAFIVLFATCKASSNRERAWEEMARKEFEAGGGEESRASVSGLTTGKSRDDKPRAGFTPGPLASFQLQRALM